MGNAALSGMSENPFVSNTRRPSSHPSGITRPSNFLNIPTPSPQPHPRPLPDPPDHRHSQPPPPCAAPPSPPLTIAHIYRMTVSTIKPSASRYSEQIAPDLKPIQQKHAGGKSEVDDDDTHVNLHLSVGYDEEKGRVLAGGVFMGLSTLGDVFIRSDESVPWPESVRDSGVVSGKGQSVSLRFVFRLPEESARWRTKVEIIFIWMMRGNGKEKGGERTAKDILSEAAKNGSDAVKVRCLAKWYDEEDGGKLWMTMAGNSI